MRSFFLLLIIAVATEGVAHAQLEVPKFKKGGMQITLQAGAAVPHLDTGNLDSQFTPFIASRFYSQPQTAAGVGFLVGLIAWHPLELFFLKKEDRPFGLDFSTHVGLGYGIVGVSGPPALGMDGIIVQWGFNIDYFLTRYFAIEFFTKCNFLRSDKFYFDWDSAHQNPPIPGSAASLNPVAGGTWWHVGLALVLRVGD